MSPGEVKSLVMLSTLRWEVHVIKSYG